MTDPQALYATGRRPRRTRGSIPIAEARRGRDDAAAGDAEAPAQRRSRAPLVSDAWHDLRRNPIFIVSGS